ncbi:MAG TPA: NAD(P)/FAD-dependent oxidoreductase, partial [Roseiarcus sp.]|nr:NAD(P)/FAD-dependent oxidoreductase [Roseiarcus sp.]
HALPEGCRHAIVDSTLGPLGAAPMRDRVLGRTPTLLGCTLESAEACGGRARLILAQADGMRETVTADHVIAATGYRVDLGRLAFLDRRLAERVKTENGKPALSVAYETSVPGLHVIGPAAAFSFGPVCRFVFGAVHPARAIARAIGKRASIAVRNTKVGEARVAGP